MSCAETSYSCLKTQARPASVLHRDSVLAVFFTLSIYTYTNGVQFALSRCLILSFSSPGLSYVYCVCILRNNANTESKRGNSCGLNVVQRRDGVGFFVQTC